MSDYPRLISNKLHSFRNFEKQIYNTSVKIYRTKKLNNGSRVTGSAI